MTTQDFIIAQFCAVDQEMLDVSKHPDAKLYPSAVVTLALLFAIKGGGTRAFYRWLTRDSLMLVPQVPERTRLARLFKTHTASEARGLTPPCKDICASQRDSKTHASNVPAQSGWRRAVRTTQ